ncbi:uncharacterized protein F5147DRAFT_777206 [Suillus discolor]|uniref:Uncharacterized protein n=1 Tax=Suillus discolor TaxID=1912936 RepID=A0A9P7JQV0_9AGAM|nr:uncharacterized protein F5147DRAFT_777206 [Suillus discolor]KAG2099894.1 hypothetical protein F5147DRAFT_777206 [Suillus discolor]
MWSLEIHRFPYALFVQQPRKGFCQSLQKLKNGLTKKLPKHPKRTHNRTTAVQNVDIEGALLSQKSRPLYPSNDNKHLTTSQIPSDSVNQGLSGEPASQATPSGEEEEPDPQLVDVELQGACDGMQSMELLGKHAAPMKSAAGNASASLAVADDFEAAYLQPLKMIGSVLEKIADVHPYAKTVLGMLSAVSKIMIAQAEWDKYTLNLLKKLAD